MANQLKTQRNDSSVKAFLDSVTDEIRRRDAYAVSGIMQDVTGEKPAMWGTSMVGFGSYHYRYDSGQEGDWPLVGRTRQLGVALLRRCITEGFSLVIDCCMLVLEFSHRSPHAMDHPRPSQDRPDRLSLAYQAVHR